MTREEAVEAAGDDEELLFLDPDSLDVAIFGVTLSQPGRPSVVIYDREKIIEVFERDMTYEEAVEFVEFNTIGAWVGERTPIFISLERA